MTNGPEHGRAGCTPLVREQRVCRGHVDSLESQELPYSKLVLSHGIKTTDFPFDFQELLSYQRKASIKCVPPLPLHFGELLSQERLHFCFQILEGHRIYCTFLQCPGTLALKQKTNDGQAAKQILWSWLCEEADPTFFFLFFFFFFPSPEKAGLRVASWKPFLLFSIRCRT